MAPPVTRRRRNRTLLSVPEREMFDELDYTLHVTRATLAYTDTTVNAKLIAELPSYAFIESIQVDVTTAFNDSGTDQLNLGKAGSATFYKSALDVSATGQTATGWSNLGSVGDQPMRIFAYYAGQNSNATAGAATVTIRWIVGPK